MKNKNIDRWMLLLLVVLLTACSGDDKEEIANPDEDCYLDIYVYAPDKPIVTRADVGEIASFDEETIVHSLQIWVFKKSNGENVGYLDADPQNLNEKGQQKYQMMISNEFARYPENVDVYVVANAASCGQTSLGPNTKRSDLDEAMIGSAYFGTTDLYGKNELLSTGRIATQGLPMSVVAKNQPVTGSYPTLRVGTSDKMTVMQLSRAVSKLRFVLCRITETSSTTKKLVSIDGISLAANQIPTQTYLMPGLYNYSSYTEGAVTYVDEANKLLAGDIPPVADPLVYAYETQGAQEYENQINNAITDGLLKELGLTYFRESNKQMTGTITYTYSEKKNEVWEDQHATATFSMAAPGDFLRNHSWIIYIYYMDSKIYTLTVTNIGMSSWETDPLDESKTVYNW